VNTENGLMKKKTVKEKEKETTFKSFKTHTNILKCNLYIKVWLL